MRRKENNSQQEPFPQSIDDWQLSWNASKLLPQDMAHAEQLYKKECHGSQTNIFNPRHEKVLQNKTFNDLLMADKNNSRVDGPQERNLLKQKNIETKDSKSQCSKSRKRKRTIIKALSIVSWVFLCPLMTCIVCANEKPDMEDEDDYMDDPIFCCLYKTDFVPSYK